MPTSLTLLTAGDPVDASVLMTRSKAIQRYVNETNVAADRAATWCSSNHVYRPDFYGAPNPRTVLTCGCTWFRSVGPSVADQWITSFYLGEGPFPVPGLFATMQFPESLAQPASNGVNYRLNVFASFYAFEYGGNSTAVVDEYTNQGATFHLGAWSAPSAPSAIRDETSRRIYKGSFTGTATNYIGYYPRKQHSMAYAFAGNTKDISTPGVIHVGVWCKPLRPATPADPEWKHIFVLQRNFIARGRIR